MASWAELKDLVDLPRARPGRDRKTVRLLLHNKSPLSLYLSLTSEPYLSVCKKRNPTDLGKRPLLPKVQSRDIYEIILSCELLNAYYLANASPLWPNMSTQHKRSIMRVTGIYLSLHVDTNCVPSVHFPKFPLSHCFNPNRRFSALLTASSCSQLQAHWPPVMRQEPRTNVSQDNFVHYAGKGTSATTVGNTPPKDKLQTKLPPSS